MLLLAVGAQAQTETALDRYVAAPDPSYSWEVSKTYGGPGYSTVVIRLTSQAWRPLDEADPHFWRHWLRVAIPSNVQGDKAILIVNGGSHNSAEPGAVDAALGLVVAATGLVVAELQAIPNQPILFTGESAPRSEDSILAFTWDKFLRGGDERWPAHLAMTKAVVRAMDATQEFMASALGGQIAINGFMVGGGSKRGWATWLTAAADNRVTAIAPAVIDTLNVEEAFRHHWKAYGDWSPAVSDYEREGIFAWFGSRRSRELMAIVDPYSYLDRLTMPKYIINSAGDEFFVPTSSQFYYDDLQGAKRLRYIPNVPHGLGDSLNESLMGAVSWGHALMNGGEIPDYSWEFAPDGRIAVTAGAPPAAVKLWQATNPSARDFRVDTIGEAWTSTDLEPSGDGRYEANPGAPFQGWRAYFIELTFTDGFLFPIKFTTAVRVVPDVLPFNEPVATLLAAHFDPRTAPDAIASAFGENFASGTATAASRPLPTELLGVQVRVRDSNGAFHPAQLFFVSPGQINYLIPPAAAPGIAEVEVLQNGQPVSAGQLLIERVAPGLFSANADGEGVAAAVLQTFRPDGRETWRYVFDEALPEGQRVAIPVNIGTAQDQSYLLLFGTGMRHGNVLEATVGGVETPAAGPVESSEFAGLDQVNLGPLPHRLDGSGEVEIQLKLDGVPLNTVTVNIK